MSLSLFCAPYWQVESVPVQEGSGTGGSGGMVVGRLHPCLGFPRPPGTPTILTTHHLLLTPDSPHYYGGLKASLEGFYNGHGCCYIPDKMYSCKAMGSRGGAAGWGCVSLESCTKDSVGDF